MQERERERHDEGGPSCKTCVFVCKSNSARSIAAECIARHTTSRLWGATGSPDEASPAIRGPQVWPELKFYSAGTRLEKQPGAIKEAVSRALVRAGYPVEGLQSKSIEVLMQELGGSPIDYIVTMCCEAEGDLHNNASVRAALRQCEPDGAQIRHLSFEVAAPTDACRQRGLTGCEPAANVHYDIMLQTVECFVATLPDGLRQARPLCFADLESEGGAGADLPPCDTPPPRQTPSLLPCS
jgi:protein-tyrosine-phosphatase